jgi:integrase/recombinase XerD
LRFERDVDVQELLKNHFPDLRWSMTHKVWHVPFDAKFTQEIFQLLKGKAYVDYSAIKLIENSTVIVEKKETQNSVLPPLDAAKQQSVEVYIRYLKSKRYSENTVKTYSEAIQLFFALFSLKIH